jgi:hypothetical protein
MKYLKSLIELEHWIDERSFAYNLLFIFIGFVLVYRIGLNRWIYLQWPKAKKYKVIYCSACFGFWITLLFSTNVLTAASAFLIYSFYEKDYRN